MSVGIHTQSCNKVSLLRFVINNPKTGWPVPLVNDFPHVWSHLREPIQESFHLRPAFFMQSVSMYCQVYEMSVG